MSDQVGNPKDRFCRDTAHIVSIAKQTSLSAGEKPQRLVFSWWGIIKLGTMNYLFVTKDPFHFCAPNLLKMNNYSLYMVLICHILCIYQQIVLKRIVIASRKQVRVTPLYNI